MNQSDVARDERLWLLPSLPVVVFILVFYQSLFFMPQMINAGDGDLGRHLTVGEFILQTGQIPTRDVFSHTLVGAPLVPHEWLSEVVFALAYRLAGLNGVAWLTALTLALTFAIVAQNLQALGAPALIAGLAGYFASIVAAVHGLPRPHIFTWLCFAMCLSVLENHRRRGKRYGLLWLLPLVVVWANLHGGFLTGLMLVSLYALGACLEKQSRRFWELSGILIVSLLFSCINPVGAQLATHSVGYLQSRFLVDVTVEYQSPNFHQISVSPFTALLLFSLVVGWRSQRRFEWTPVVLLIAWSAFALYSARNIPLYAQVAAAVLAPVVADAIAAGSSRVSRFVARMEASARGTWGWHWVVIGAVVLIGLSAHGVNFDARRQGNQFDARVFPIAAVDYIRTAPLSGRMFNQFTWGGYLLFRLFPGQRVFIDGQTDFYGEALTRDYLRIWEARSGWDALLDRYDVRWVIVAPDSPLAARLDESPMWVSRYRDETAGVWTR